MLRREMIQIESNNILILHISDLHVKSEKADNAQLDRNLAAIKREWDEQTNSAKADLIVITGDITFSGKEKEFEQASEIIQWLRGLLSEDTNSDSGIFVVPGNHDLDRDILAKNVKWEKNEFHRMIPITKRNGEPLPKNDKAVLLNSSHPYFAESAEEFNEVWSDRDYWDKVISQRFRNYADWFKNNFGHCRNVDDRCGGLWHWHGNVKNRNVHITGLNSAVASTGWFEGLDDGTVFISEEQVRMRQDHLSQLFSIENVAFNNNDMSIILSHHNFDSICFCDRFNSESVLSLRYNSSIILAGHCHSPAYHITYAANGIAPLIGVRALTCGDGAESHGYNIIRIKNNIAKLTRRSRGIESGYRIDMTDQQDNRDLDLVIPVGYRAIAASDRVFPTKSFEEQYALSSEDVSRLFCLDTRKDISFVRRQLVELGKDGKKLTSDNLHVLRDTISVQKSSTSTNNSTAETSKEDENG